MDSKEYQTRKEEIYKMFTRGDGLRETLDAIDKLVLDTAEAIVEPLQQVADAEERLRKIVTGNTDDE